MFMDAAHDDGPRVLGSYVNEKQASTAIFSQSSACA